ncbi:MAG: hypothetical protein Q7J32_17585 [Sphingomonadaceae bacterium]|nr:hypothetical protein [Sphingomonadaceae bacterium]
MARLDAEIADNGRSLAQEIEARIELSLKLEDELGGNIDLHLAIARALKAVEAQFGPLPSDDVAFEAGKAAVESAIDLFRPPLPVEEYDAFAAIDAEYGAAKVEFEAVRGEVRARVGEPARGPQWRSKSATAGISSILSADDVFNDLLDAGEVESAIKARDLDEDDASLARAYQSAIRRYDAARMARDAFLKNIATRRQTARQRARMTLESALAAYTQEA